MKFLISFIFLLLSSSLSFSAIGNFGHDYETVAASQVAQVLGDAGKLGNVLEKLILIPVTVSAGSVTITDGTLAQVIVFPGGTNSLTELKPIVVEISARSQNGPWKVTTGANITVIAIGAFL